jgi:hypothetical protein
VTWEEKISKAISSNPALDEIYIKDIEKNETFPVPNIVKATLHLLENVLQQDTRKAIVVFPEKRYLSFLTVVMHAVSEIITDKKGTVFDFREIQEGQLMKINNYICKFECLKTDKDSIKRIWVRFADENRAYPIEIAPFFQKVGTNRQLSKAPKTCITRKDNNKASTLEILEASKTYLSTSICYITPTNAFKSLFSTISLNDKNLSDLLLDGAVSFDDYSVKSITSGQLDGNPAILLASDLYVLNSYIEKGNKVNSVFINIPPETVEKHQLDALDKLLTQKIPVIFLTNSENSLELAGLEERNFPVLRWDNRLLNAQLCNTTASSIGLKIANCKSQNTTGKAGGLIL